MKQKIWVLALTAFLTSGFLYTHGGGLDRNGGHYNRKTGVYHCHRCPCGCDTDKKSDRPASPRPRSPSPSGEAKGEQAGNPDAKVWVNTNSGVYHCPGARWYGNTKQGEYMTQKQAQEQGYRAAYGNACR